MNEVSTITAPHMGSMRVAHKLLCVGVTFHEQGRPLEVPQCSCSACIQQAQDYAASTYPLILTALLIHVCYLTLTLTQLIHSCMYKPPNFYSQPNSCLLLLFAGVASWVPCT